MDGPGDALGPVSICNCGGRRDIGNDVCGLERRSTLSPGEEEDDDDI